MLEAPANRTGPIIGFNLLRPKHISSIVRFLHKIVLMVAFDSASYIDFSIINHHSLLST